MKPFRTTLSVLIVSGASIAAGFFGFNLLQNAQFAQAQEKVEATREQLASVEDLATVFRHVGKVVEPSVVHINIRKTTELAGRNLPFDEDMLRQFFPDQNGDGEPDVPPGFGERGRQFEQRGTGSGVIMEVEDGYGYVVTNNHVAGGATEMTITLSDGRTIEDATLVGTDPKTDLAVVKIKADRIIASKWGNSDELAKGDWVMAFGSPFGFVGSMTHGIVSALNRDNVGILGRFGYENFIQVDAPINPGNSGGPLTNVRGEVIGINTAIASQNGGFQGIGFAIPSNQAKMVYQALRTSGKVVRGYLGVEIADVQVVKEEAEAAGYEGTSGVYVKGAQRNTPATGKLEPGDIITSVNDNQVKNSQQLRTTIAATPPGTTVKLEVFRAGKTMPVEVAVGELPDNPEVASLQGGRSSSGSSASASALGMNLSALNDDLIKRYSLPDDVEGVVITSLERNSIAAMAGAQVGDVITRIGMDKVTDLDQAKELLSKQDLSKGFNMHVTNRQGSRVFFLKNEQ